MRSRTPHRIFSRDHAPPAPPKHIEDRLHVAVATSARFRACFQSQRANDRAGSRSTLAHARLDHATAAPPAAARSSCSARARIKHCRASRKSHTIMRSFPFLKIRRPGGSILGREIFSAGMGGTTSALRYPAGFKFHLENRWHKVHGRVARIFGLEIRCARLRESLSTGGLVVSRRTSATRARTHKSRSTA
jgi:hypothetical protein